MFAYYPAKTLYETIKGFHDTIARFQAFKKAVAKDIMDRAKDVQQEIQFALDREDSTSVFGDLLATGEIPLQVNPTIPT